jgi:D-amino-acid dehydrogenase
MKVGIVGCGLIGLTTAYFLRNRGHEVTVLERTDGPGLETSFANGALLTPSMPEPWNAPGVWRVLLSSLGRSDSALQLRARAVPSLVGWGLQFLKHSRPDRYRANTLSNLRLALFSLRAMRVLRERTRIDYAGQAPGTLRVFRELAGLQAAVSVAERFHTEGLRFRKLSAREIVELEPALADIQPQLVGAVHYETDETGDAYRFCVALANELRSQGVQFRFGVSALRLEARADRMLSVSTDQGRFEADLYVVAAGSYSAQLLRPLGIDLPVQPAKGYSVTFGSYSGVPALRTPVIDDHLHAAVVPLGSSIRVAGTAEFAGYDKEIRPARIENLTRLLQQVLPRGRFDSHTARPWCGLRPMCADGVPIIGPTRITNLLVNTGHGHLGWTMAAGSGKLLDQWIAGESPSIDPAPYLLSRFSRGVSC